MSNSDYAKFQEQHSRAPSPTYGAFTHISLTDNTQAVELSTTCRSSLQSTFIKLYPTQIQFRDIFCALRFPEKYKFGDIFAIWYIRISLLCLVSAMISFIVALTQTQDSPDNPTNPNNSSHLPKDTPISDTSAFPVALTLSLVSITLCIAGCIFERIPHCCPSCRDE